VNPSRSSALIAWTSRKSSASAPGTTPAFQVVPPFFVIVNVPPAPLAQATCALSGLIARRLFSVPLCCCWSDGAESAWASVEVVGDGAVGSELSEQDSSSAVPIVAVSTAAPEMVWGIRMSPNRGEVRQHGHGTVGRRNPQDRGACRCLPVRGGRDSIRRYDGLALS
jgi:hypothetical protein